MFSGDYKDGKFTGRVTGSTPQADTYKEHGLTGRTASCQRKCKIQLSFLTSANLIYGGLGH